MNPMHMHSASAAAYPYGTGAWQYGQPMVYPWQSAQPSGMQPTAQVVQQAPPNIPAALGTGDVAVNSVRPAFSDSTPSSAGQARVSVPVVTGTDDTVSSRSDARSESSGSESGSSDSESEGKGSDMDEVSQSSTDESSVPLPSLPAEERESGFPIDARSVLSRVARDLGIAYKSDSTAVTPGVFSAACPLISDTVEPILNLPADLASVWKSAKLPPSNAPLRKGCLVAEEDFNRYLKVPVMDPEVQKRLPTEGKVDPGAYSPFWEESLKSVDSRLRAAIRVSAFGSTVAEHLARVTAKELGSTSELAREAYLLSDLTHKSLQASMSAVHRLTSLRQTNALSLLRSTYGQKFAESLKKVELPTQDFLFGNRFCELIEQRAKEVVDEKALVDTEAALKSHKKKKSKKSGKRKSSKPSTSRTSSVTPSAAKPSTSAGPSSGKRQRGGGHSSSKPPSKSYKRPKTSGKKSSS